MSYTNKEVTWEACSKTSGTIENTYGDIARSAGVVIKARHQPHRDVIRTTDGKEILTKSYFYVDPTEESHAMQIAEMDKLDGETVMQVYVMCDLFNKPRMVRFITV